MSDPLSPDLLRRMDAYWRAANYLSVGQIYLLDNPLLRQPLEPRAHQAAPARALGHDARAELHLRASQPDHPPVRPRHDLRRGPGARRAGAGREHLSGGNLQRALSRASPRTKRGCASSSSSSHFLAGFRATSRRRRRGRSTKAASWDTRSPTRIGAAFDNPSSSSPASSEMARRRPARWRQAGTPTSSSTPHAMARCCRSCTSTATRSPVRRCLRGSAREELDAASARLRVPAVLRGGRRAGAHAPADGRDA